MTFFRVKRSSYRPTHDTAVRTAPLLGRTTDPMMEAAGWPMTSASPSAKAKGE
jgi:hypothetical protein